MKKLITLMAVVSLLSIIISAEALAQRGMAWKGSGGWGEGTSYGRMYDPKTIETISGEVLSVDKITPMKGMSYGVHLTLKTDNETLSVHLGPGWFMENQDVKLESGDKIEVKGSQITFEGQSVIIAAEIKKGDAVLVLRDASGFPVWSGWRRR